VRIHLAIIEGQGAPSFGGDSVGNSGLVLHLPGLISEDTG